MIIVLEIVIINIFIHFNKNVLMILNLHLLEIMKELI